MSKEEVGVERQRLESELSEVRSRKTLLEARPQDFVVERLSRIEASIARRRNPRLTPSNPGNKTMYQHLLELKEECEKKPEIVVERELSFIASRENALLEEIDKERADEVQAE